MLRFAIFCILFFVCPGQGQPPPGGDVLHHSGAEKNSRTRDEDLYEEFKNNRSLCQIIRNRDKTALKEKIHNNPALLEQRDEASTHTPLICAIREKQKDMVKILLKAGANVNARTEDLGRTALMYAAMQKRPGMLAVLLEFEADVHVQSKGGWTALLLAAEYRSVPNLKLLLQAGADINDSNHLLETALMRSAFQGNLYVVRFLMDQGANPNLKSAQGELALHRLPPAHPDYKEMHQMLIPTEDPQDLNLFSQKESPAFFSTLPVLLPVMSAHLISYGGGFMPFPEDTALSSCPEKVCHQLNNESPLTANPSSQEEPPLFLQSLRTGPDRAYYD